MTWRMAGVVLSALAFVGCGSKNTGQPSLTEGRTTTASTSRVTTAAKPYSERVALVRAARGIIRSADLIEGGAVPPNARLRVSLNQTLGRDEGFVGLCFSVKLVAIGSDEGSRRGAAIALLEEACARLKKARHAGAIGLGDPEEAREAVRLSKSAERLARTALHLLGPGT